MSINKFITNLDLARQAEIMSGETAVFQGGIELGIPFSGFPSGVDTSTIVSLGVLETQYTAFSGDSGTTIFDIVNPSSPYYSVSAVTISASPYTVLDSGTITETVSATTYPIIMTFTALSGDCCSTPISATFNPPIVQELYDRGLYGGLFNGLGQATIGDVYNDLSFYNDGSIFSGANINMEIIDYGVHGVTPTWVTGTTSGTVIEYSGTSQYWTNPIYSSLTSGLTLPITPISSDTQTSDYVWTLTDSTIIDENFVGLQYTGYNVTYSFENVQDEPTTQSYVIGGVYATLEYFSASTLDYKGTTNWLIVNGSATIDERLTTDRMTIHTLGTGSPVTMLAVDVNGNVVGGTGGTTDDTGAFTSTTANNTIIPTNAAGNTNDSDYASILGGQNNTISGTSTSSAIVGGENNVINDSSDRSTILGGLQNTITSGHTDSVIAGGSGNTIHFGSIGNGEAIIASNDSNIMSSDTSTIIGSVDSGITGNGRTNIFGSVDVQIYGNDPDVHSGNLIMSVFEGVISGATVARRNMIAASNTSNMIGDGSERVILGSGNVNLTSGNLSGIISSFWSDIESSNTSVILGSRGSFLNKVVLTGSSSSSIISSSESKIYDSDDSSILGGENNTLKNNNNSLILGGINNTIDLGYSLWNGDRNAIISSENSLLTGNTSNSVILGGKENKMYDPDGGILTQNANSVIIGGLRNILQANEEGVIIGGRDNSIIGSNKYDCVIIGGTGNTFITTGNTNRSVILGGQGITATTDDTAYVPNLNIGTLGTGTSVNNLGIDASGNVVSGNTGSFLAAKAPEAIVTHSLTAKGIPDGQVISGYTDIRYNNTDISGTLTTPFGTFDNTTGIFTTNTDCVLNIQAWIHLKANTSSTTAWETGATPTQIGIGICPNNATDIFVGDFITILPSVSRGLDVTTGITQRVLSGTTFRIKILNQTSRSYPGPGVVSGDYMRFSITRVD